MVRLSDSSSGSRPNGRDRTQRRLDPLKVAMREANHIMACFRRHRATGSRATRDLRRLSEFIERLQRLQVYLSHLPDTARNRRGSSQCKLLERRIAVIEREHRQALAVRRLGSPSQRIQHLRQRVRDQLDCYRVHMVDKARLSRRPRLLHRIILNLEDIHSELRHPTLSGPQTGEAVRGQRAYVEHALQALRNELGAMELEHLAATTEQRVDRLSDAVSTVLEQFHALLTVDPERSSDDAPGDALDVALSDTAEPSTLGGERLGLLCERMAEFEQQFVEIAHEYLSDQLVTSLEALQHGQDQGEREYARRQALVDDLDTP